MENGDFTRKNTVFLLHQGMQSRMPSEVHFQPLGPLPRVENGRRKALWMHPLMEKKTLFSIQKLILPSVLAAYFPGLQEGNHPSIIDLEVSVRLPVALVEDHSRKRVERMLLKCERMQNQNHANQNPLKRWY